LVVLVAWVLPGAWDARVLPIAIVAVLPGLLAVAPWRHCSWGDLVLALAPAVSALAVAVVSPYGDAGVVSLSRWTYLGLLLIGVCAFARTPERRTAVVVVAALLLGWAFTQAWLPWWGHEDTAHPMVGQFYSANPFGSAMLAGVLLASALALTADGLPARVGFAIAPLCASGVFLSGSRAAIGLAAIGAGVAVAIAVFRMGARVLVRAAALVAACALFFVFLTSAVFFPDGRAGTAAGDKRSSGQTVSSTSSVRVEYWRSAWAEFRSEPLVGGGSGSYFPHSRLTMPPGVERATLAHNEPIGALAEGGLMHGLPVLVFFLLAGAACTRALLRLKPGDAGSPAAAAAAIAAGALVAHGLLDIGLAFPALLGVLALLLGVVRAAHSRPPRRAARPAGVIALLAGLTLAGTYVAGSHQRVDDDVRRPTADAAPLPGVRDARALVAALQLQAAGASTAPADRVLADSERLVRFDGNVQADRIAVLLRKGRIDAAGRAAARLAQESRDAAPRLVLPLADVLVREGETDLAADLLGYEAWMRTPQSPALVDQFAELAAAAAGSGGVDSLAARCAATRFPSEASVAGRRLTPAGVTPPTDGTCQAWSRAAAGSWERSLHFLRGAGVKH